MALQNAWRLHREMENMTNGRKPMMVCCMPQKSKFYLQQM